MPVNNKALHLLKHPYPVSTSAKEIISSSLIVAVLGYFFLAIYQPFGTIYLPAKYKYLLLAPYAVMYPAILALANFWLRGRGLKWNLNNEIVKILATLVLGTVCNYIYNITFINHVPFSIGHLFSMLFYTSTLAMPILLIYLLVRYVYLQKPVVTEIVVPPVQTTPSIPKKTINIQPDGGTGTLQINEEDFLFAESQGNYCNVVYLDNATAVKALLRMPIKTLYEQVESTSVIRCHRSYIINTARVTLAKGNAQGYKLSVDSCNVTVPVSRSFIPAIQKALNLATE